MTKRLVLAMYRGLLAWSRQNRGVPLQLRSTDVYSCIPESRAFANLDVQDATAAVESLTRIGFRSGKQLQGAEASAALESGLLALRLLQTEYAAQLRLMRETRADKANREGIKFDVGTVFLHKKFGYRGLLIGWDRECTRDEDWVREAGVDPRQPFYYVLPDEMDCVRLFGQPLSSRYVAQDNVLPLPGERILHRALNHYFTCHSAALGRYVPSQRLQYEYPGHYGVEEEEGSDSVAVDSNLLLHPEEGEGEGGRVGGKGRGRRRSPYKTVNRQGLGGEQEATI